MNSTDGFVRRTRRPAVGRPTLSTNPSQPANSGFAIPNRHGVISNRPSVEQRPTVDQTQAKGKSVQLDIEDILQRDKDLPKKGILGRGKKDKGPRRRLSKKKIALRILTILLIGAIGFGGYFGWKIFHNASKVFKGNVLSAVFSSDKPLKTDSNGRTNVLLFGTSEDDPNHPGAQLTDSMMIVSINQKTHDAFLISIPRDLWVKYDSPCSVGYEGKINSVYECTLSNTNNNEQQAEQAVGSKVGSVFGVDLQYTIHVNLTVLKDVVDAVGGIDITIQSPDPRGILDRNFDWRCNYKCYLVKYPNGPAHLNGTQAMYLAQARNDSGGYGLPRSNFDREDNQRKILIAVKDRATSVGFLANPVNVINLMDSLGSNVRTNIDTSEIRSFINVAKAIPANNITSIDILNTDSTLLTTGSGPDGSSVVEPTAGLYDYSGIAAFMQPLLQGQAGVIVEKAPVDVLNGSGTQGLAQQKASDLQQSGFTIGTVATAPTGTYTPLTLYDLSKGTKPQTLAALEAKLGVKSASATLPAGVTSTSQFVVIVGPQATTTTGSTSNSGN